MKRGQLLLKLRLHGGFQAAQIQPQRVVVQAANHGAGQGAQACFQLGELAARLLAAGRVQLQAIAGQAFHGQGAAANLAVHGGSLHHPRVAQHGLQLGGQMFGLGLHVGWWAGKQAQRGQALGQFFGVQVQAQRGLQRCQRELAHAQGTLHGVFFDFGDQFFAPDDDARLRAPQQLVTAEGDDVRPRIHGFAHGDFMGQTPVAQIDQGAAAQIHHHGQATGMGHGGDFGVGDGLGKAHHFVVAGVHLHEQGSVLSHRLGVVFGVRAVGGAYFYQLAACTFHDVGDAEGATNFHQLAARDHHLFARCQRRQRQQHRSGIVVDDGGSFGPGQFANQLLNQIIAVATATSGQVVFEVGGVGEGFDHRIHGLLRQQGTAQVGVQHRACEVEYGFQAWGKARCQALVHGLGQCGFFNLCSLQAAFAQLGAQAV